MPPNRSPPVVPDGGGSIPISDYLAHWGKPLQISLVPVTLAPIRGIIWDGAKPRPLRGIPVRGAKPRLPFGGDTLIIALVVIRFRWI
jgi:hypothetical protein